MEKWRVFKRMAPTGMYWYEWHVWKKEENKGGLKDEYNKEGLKIKYRGLKEIFKVFVFG